MLAATGLYSEKSNIFSLKVNCYCYVLYTCIIDLLTIASLLLPIILKLIALFDLPVLRYCTFKCFAMTPHHENKIRNIDAHVGLLNDVCGRFTASVNFKAKSKLSEVYVCNVTLVTC